MIRECVECHRAQDVGSVVASGGMVGPPGIYEWPTPEWRCPDCRSKYPEPIEYLITCVECEGEGYLEVTHGCRHCDHVCETTQACVMCDGEGSYPTHDCNPGCDHHFYSLRPPEIKVPRGPIRFFEHPV